MTSPNVPHRPSTHDRGRLSSAHRRRQGLAITAVFALLAGLLGVLALSAPAQAAPGDPFDGDEPTVFIAQGPDGLSPTQLSRAVTGGDGATAFQHEGPTAPVRYNGIGYREVDHYLYGFVGNGFDTGIPQGALIRIGEAGAVERVGTQTFGPNLQLIGAFADDGLLYSTHPVETQMNIVDVSSGTQTGTVTLSQTFTDAGLGADMTYADGYFWALSAGTIGRINPSTGQIDTWPIDAAPAGAAGAAWTYGNGNLGFSFNLSGQVTQIRVTDPGAANPTFTIVSRAPGPANTDNDGAASRGAPVDLALTKTGPSTVTPGGQISYTLTVANNGPGNSAGWVVNDELPAGLTNIQASGNAHCEVDGQLVTCTGGQLANGNTAQITITADLPGDLTGCITNNGSVLGHQEDPNPGNNESSVTSCALALNITKTSDVGPDPRPGDTVTYTVTATNDSQGDYTADNPAVVADDLTGVLDDGSYNDDAQANQAGSLSYSAPNLVWSGALPAGQSVTITYTVTLGPGGDGVVRNVAWAPPAGTPPGQLPPTPACDPPNSDGNDPATGLPCAEVEYLLPKLTIEKTTDRTELPRVGEELTYTVTIRNPGPGSYSGSAPASFTDDLSDVLQDATFDEGSIIVTGGGSASYAAPVVSWSGPLASGASVTIQYTVTYTGDGDQRLDNEACVPASEVAAGEPSCASVSVPGALLSQSKASVPSDTPLMAGSTVEYTLWFENNGQAAAAVDAIDYLEYVLDDAEVVDGPTAESGLTAALEGDRIAITGSVPVGERLAVTYTVRILPDSERGDDRLVNHLLDRERDPIPDPPDVDGPCEQTTTSTCHDVGQIDYVKDVQADTDPVGAGTVLTYTITIDNPSRVDVPVAREDVLSDVLDDATMTSDPSSDTDSVTVSEITDERFAMGGTLAAGQTAIVTYQVTVNHEDDRGNDSADNFLVPPGEDPPEECENTDTSTCTPLPNIGSAKSSDPESGSVVHTGEEVTYTLTFTNTGQAAGPVDFIDHLDGVLDDATLVGQPSTSSGDLAAGVSSRDRLLIAGTLQPGQSETVSYTVRVNPEEDRGDSVLANFLTRTNEPPPEVCEDDDPNCTTHPMPEVIGVKSVDPSSGTAVRPGGQLTYTLSFTNRGTATGAVDYVDHLGDVLDDAELVGSPRTTGGLAVDGPRGEQLAVTGDLEAGASAEVTFTVRVKESGRGNDRLLNFLVRAGEDPPAECAETSSLCTDNRVTLDPPGGALPDAGGPDYSLPLLIAALLALSIGVVILWTRRWLDEGEEVSLGALL